MSIPTLMKFLVRGKSVDFRNREGSSPSIPKSLFNSLIFYPISPFLNIIHKVFFFYLVDTDSINLLKLGWCVKNGRDSSAGRAED